jgi:antitoxin (DNA-binding transcriptional repressor) of toxin-antitoxin stability system
MATSRISEAEAVRDFAALLTRVRAGEEIVIESDAAPVALLRPATPFRGRLLSESIALADTHAKELGYEPVMNGEFAARIAGEGPEVARSGRGQSARTRRRSAGPKLRVNRSVQSKRLR